MWYCSPADTGQNKQNREKRRAVEHLFIITAPQSDINMNLFTRLWTICFPDSFDMAVEVKARYRS
ncbi:MAG: hypothetical protein ACRC7W_01585, partial [Fusobacteriaceae bacterium]